MRATTEFSPTQLRHLAGEAQIAARLAGQRILSLYRRDNSVRTKDDGSPLTLADEAAHDAIHNHLTPLGLPIISEEAVARDTVARYYWLVDPLDGTKDFLAANDEFTVNIALVDSDAPVLGILHAPAFDELYVGIRQQGSWLERAGRRLTCSPQARAARLRMATSRFHDSEEAAIFARANKIDTCIPIGAALKYGRMALGEVDLYPRLVGTSEWDTAAGQAVLEAAGGGLFDWHTGAPLRYGKAGRRNGRFIALRSPYQWADFRCNEFRGELP